MLIRGLLLVTLSILLTCPTFGQYVGGEAGATIPMGSISYASTGVQGGVIGRVPLATSNLNYYLSARLGYNTNSTPQGKIQRTTGLLGPEVTYVSGRMVTVAQLGGGVSVRFGDDETTDWLIRSRLAVGTETASGRQLTVGPTYALTTDNQWWWGLSCAFSF